MNQSNNIDRYLNCNVLQETGREQVRAELVSYMEAVASSDCQKTAAHTPRLIAAFLCGLVLIAFAVVCIISFNGKAADVHWTRLYTGKNEKVEITLPDNSTIWLNSESEIFYPDNFIGKERRVFVSGEAYASISKDARKPFVVEAEGMAISVHGTKFNVKAYRDSDSREVFLEEGSVSLSFGSKGNSILMVPNDLVRYSVSQDSMEKISVSRQVFPDWRKCRSLCFVNMKFSDIVPELERFYNTKIIVAGGVPTDTRVYASFINGEDIFEVLDAINIDRRMKISRVEDCILISYNK